MIDITKHLFLAFILTICPINFFVSAQSVQNSYPELWQIISSDHLEHEEKLKYIDAYIRKAQEEDNLLEEYKAYKRKSFLVPFSEAVEVVNQMKPLVKKINSDSVTGDFLNRSVVLYYKERRFDKALDYAIQSEAFNENNNNLYNLSSVRIDIGNIYFHTKNYAKAKEYFRKAKKYYKEHEEYNHVRGYINTLYGLSKINLKLKETDHLSSNIEEIERLLPQLRPVHQSLENAYLDQLKAGLAFIQKDYNTSKLLFRRALPEIKSSGDFNNEYFIYLHLGKIEWEQNQKEEAVRYFNRVDLLFQEKKFLNYELRTAYLYLIDYYKEEQQFAKQLIATEHFIALNQQYEKEQQNITETLHYELETKKLEQNKMLLQKQIKKSKSSTYWVLFIGNLVVLLLILVIIQLRKQKIKQRIQYENLLKTALKSAERPVEKTICLSPSDIRIQKSVDIFEREKGYLKPVKLDDLAEIWNTNRTTLSLFFNTHKGGFNNYVNKLRIDEVIKSLKEYPEIRRKSMEQIALKFGFTSTKTFANQFKSETGLAPSYFIKQLEIDDMQVAKSVFE